MILDWFVANWVWTLFLILFGMGAVLMRKIPNTQIIGNIIFKINSQKGIRLMNRLGTKYSGFWRFIGDFSLIVLFGGIGTAYVANHQGEKGRRVLLASLAFFVVFVYLGPNTIQLFPFLLYISQGALPLLLAATGAILTYRFAGRASNRLATLLAFFLAMLFFGSPYIMNFLYMGGPLSLALGLFVGALGLPAIMIAMLSIQAVNISTGLSTQPGVNIGYPGIEDGVPVLKYAGTDISIPFFPDILIAFIVMLVLHEGFHGLLARAQNIPLRNTGLLFASIVPLGAFVEPDEKKFKKEGRLKRLRVYSVGSFANIFVIALLTFLIGNLMLSTGILQSDGVFIAAVVNDTAASTFIEPGDIIYSIDERTTKSWDDVTAVMSDTSANQTVSIVTNRGEFEKQLGQSTDGSDRGFLGVQPAQDISENIQIMFAPGTWSSHLEPSLPTTTFNILKWVFFLNLMIGIVNLLPIKPLDGGYVYEGFFEWIEECMPSTRRIHLASVFSQVFLLLIILIFVINGAPYFFS